jgi:chemotaxis protein CheC
MSSEQEPRVRAANSVDRLSELLNIGAGHAAGALALLLGRTFWMRVPRVRRFGAGAGPAPQLAAAGVGGAALLFEVDGSLGGIVAFCLPGASLEALRSRLLGARAETPPELVESALREAGNVVVSHVCSAIADTLGARLVPSLPRLVLEAGEAELAALAARRSRAWLRIESEIVDAQGELRGLLVFLPDAPPRSLA